MKHRAKHFSKEYRARAHDFAQKVRKTNTEILHKIKDFIKRFPKDLTKNESLFLADTLSIIHILTIAIIFLGWLVSPIHSLYMFILVATIASWIWYDACILTVWEYELRKRFETNMDYDYSYISYFIHKQFPNFDIQKEYIRYFGIIFLTVSFFLNVFFN